MADIPERKADLVAGIYELDIPAGSAAVGVKITDMLGEEVLEMKRSLRSCRVRDPDA